MMMMRRIVCMLSLLLLPSVFPLQAHQLFQISDSPGHSHSCRVATDAWTSTVVAWVEEDSGVWTRTWRDGELHAPIFHGPGELPDVAALDFSGFVLAWVRDGTIVLREGDGLDWTEIRVYAQDAAPLTMPRLTSFITNQWVRGVYLCWQNFLGEIYFAERESGDWQDPEYVMPLDGWMGFAQAVPGPPEDPWQPRTFAMWNEGLVYSQRSAAGWSDPVPIAPITMPYGNEFDMGGGGNHPAQLLSNGPQPTCPCNEIKYAQELPGTGWTEPENLTYYFDEYTWPMDPAVEVGPTGRVHAFWYQQHYDMMMQPSFEGVFYRVLEEGTWSDETAILQGHFGKDTDMDLGGYDTPAFVWSEGVEEERDIWLAILPLVDAAPPTPVAELALSASPNPFNPRTELRFHLPQATRLSLEIIDPEGRQVAHLAEGRYPAGTQRFTWSGRDDSGRGLPSGVYLAKLKTETGVATLKLVMLQ
jgi:hypothetical protein